MSLPYLPSVYGHAKNGQISFGGLNHNLYAGDGEIWDMQNLSSRNFPLISPRLPRYTAYSVTAPQGITANDGLYYVDNNKLYKNGTALSVALSNARAGEPRTLVTLGDHLCIFPDAVYYKMSDGKSGALGASEPVASAEIKDGKYAGEDAEKNTLVVGATVAAAFRVGDAVSFTGLDDYLTTPGGALIIREIDGGNLVFYENTFKQTGSNLNITISRDIPDMDFICENENRLWGCKGDTIYASKLGDPFNWNVFDGISTDSYSVEVGSAGSFTACCSYLGYPVFFKEDHIYKVYGDRPTNYQVMSSASLGVEKGSAKSLAIAGEILFYLSRAGVMAYSGGIPQLVSAPLGTGRYKDAVGGSDGIKYYISMADASGNYSLYVYDTRYQLWHREDNLRVYGFAWDSDLYLMTGTAIYRNGGSRITTGTKEATVSSYAEFGDFVENSPNAKYVSKLQLRCELAAGAKITVKAKYNGGAWETLAEYFGPLDKNSYYIPMIPRRVDHYRLRIEGAGDYSIYSLTRVYDNSSELRTK